MPIEMSCTCGKALTLRDELAGKLIRCPSCAGTIEVPLPAVEVVEEIAAGPPPLPRPGGTSVAAGPPPLPRTKANEIDVAPPPLTPPKPKEPKKKKKKKSVYSQKYGNEGRENPLVVFDEGWFGSVNSGIIGGSLTLFFGILLMILTIMFFSVYGVVFSIILIVTGLIAIMRGLMNLYEE